MPKLDGPMRLCETAEKKNECRETQPAGTLRSGSPPATALMWAWDDGFGVLWGSGPSSFWERSSKGEYQV